MKSSNFSKKLAVRGTAAAVALGTFAFATPATADTATNGPKNVILMIGDGMGYNHLDNMNSFENNEVYWQVDRGGDNKVKPWGGNATPDADDFQSWERVSMQTNWAEAAPYDTTKAWTDFEYIKDNPTDSAAAGTAMATGVKTYNAGIGVDVDENIVENVSERAHEIGKSAGVVSSVPFSHATPAAFSSHNVNRNDYHGIAQQQVDSEYMDVVMGAGHPFFNDDHEKIDTGDFGYISEESFNKLSKGESEFSYIEENADFEALTTGETPEKVFGIPQVGSTLQQARSNDAVLNDVVDLPTMTKGALNVLDNNAEGFFLMVEGGAIDWTGHANETQRNIEETLDFAASIDAVTEWVDTNSSWDETIVIVTADHETGYLAGAHYLTDENGDPRPILDEDGNATQYNYGEFGEMVPAGEGTAPSHAWFSNNHTTQLVPYFVKGANQDELLAKANMMDTVRGNYLDNTAMAKWLLEEAWVPAQNPEPSKPGETPAPSGTPTPSASAVATDADKTTAPAKGTDKNTEAGGSLATTGANSFAPIALIAAVLVAAGAGALALRNRRSVTDAE